jgi:ATP-dependent protease ClpP protease subunit
MSKRNIAGAVLVLGGLASYSSASISVAQQEDADAKSVSMIKMNSTEALKYCSQKFPSLSSNDYAISQVICLNGDGREGARTTWDTLTLFYKQFHKDAHTVVIRSPGGPVSPAIIIGEAIMASQLDVVVDGQCLSSCANYIFPSGRFKVMPPDAKVAWHGVPVAAKARNDDRNEKRRANLLNLDVQRHDVFVKRLEALGIDPRFMTSPPSTFKYEAGKIKFWFYSADTLSTRFNVPGIITLKN